MRGTGWPIWSEVNIGSRLGVRPHADSHPGDCDLDGYVHVNELNRAVKITMGEAPLARCRAADIDGDGTVTVNEVVQGITKLMKGCLQESQP